MRYFYTDPLAAAWMAKHFGMIFGINHYGKMVWDCQSQGASGNWNPIRDWEHIAADAADGNSQPAYYIHPDSLHLLEMKEDDVGLFDWDEVGYYHSADGNCRKIIQRGRIPFMWPESEDA